MFKKVFYCLRLLIIICVTAGINIFPALEHEEPGFANFLFEDYSVTAVSKKVEKMSTSPGIISVITQKDIYELGVHTIAEAIGMATNVLYYDSYFTEFNQFAIRGNIGGEHFNSKILFLINGHPNYFAIHGGFEVNSIPLEAVEKIEIVRGPASVLYGTNALTGVINIITRKNMAEATMAEAGFYAGSFDTKEVRLSTGSATEDFSFFSSLTIRDQDGYDLTILPEQDESGQGYEHTQKEEYNTFFTNITYKDLEIDLSYWKEDFQSKIGIVPISLFRIPYFEQEYFYTDIRYKHGLSENSFINFVFRYDYNHLEYELPDGHFIEFLYFGLWNPREDQKVEGGNEKVGGEIYGDFMLTDKFNLISGISYDKYYDAYYESKNPYQADGYSPSSPWKGDRENYDISAYANFSYTPTEPLNLVGGFRYSENDITGDHSDYRLGIIYSINENLTLKALHGTSYRSPGAFELFGTSVPIVSGNEDNEPETLVGTDIGVHYTFGSKLLLSLTYYSNETEDFIKRVTQNTGAIEYQNIEGEKNKGIECEIKYRPLDNLNIFFNGSRILDSEELATGNELLVVEEIYSFGFALYLLEDSLMLSNSNMYHSEWGSADSFIISNIAISFQPEFSKNIKLYLTVNNAFDKEYTYPEFSRRVLEEIPGGALRSYTLGLKTKF